MRPLINPTDMRGMEKRYFAETGMPSIDLMERAARELTGALLNRFGRDATFYFACGPGGNGGDGYAAARMIRDMGGRSVLFSAREPSSPDAAENLRRARAAGVPERDPDAPADAPGVWVDALYGTGLSRPPEGTAARLIERMNADRARGSAVAAVDIPSGLNGTSGRAYRPCVRADATFTFQYAKPGCYLEDGPDMSGAVEALDIGIPGGFYPPDQPALAEDGDVRAFLPERPRNIHKGDCGHLLIVAGSFGMAGAAAMCARAALRSGVGLVTVACPRSIVPILQTLVPCAMCAPLPESDGAVSADAAETLYHLLPGKSAVACGCGLSLRAAPEAVRVLADSGLPALFDADALNLIAADPALRRALSEHHLITPHPGEAARLLGRPVTDPAADAFALRGTGCQVLLKGACSVICVGARAILSATGCSGMARGGSGDSLSGIIGALMAQKARAAGGLSGTALAECAAAGSEIHGTAGEIAQARFGARGMTAMDIVEALPEAFRRYDR